MKKLQVAALLFGSLLLAGCDLPFLGSSSSGVLIESIPPATVFIDDKQMGPVPYENKKLEAGEITVRLAPGITDPPTVGWEGKVRLTPGVQTIIRRELAGTQSASSGELLTFDKIGGKSAALSVISTPDASAVKVDGQSQGFSPVAVESMPEGDHQILLSAPGYQDKLIAAKAIAGYRLIVSAQLAQLAQPISTPSATPIATGSPTPSGKATPKPTTTPKATATPKASASATIQPQASLPPKPYVQIQNTDTGFLRVRSDPSTSGTELTRVNPGSAYPYKDTSADGKWYQIEYETGKTGWVSAQYATKVE